MTVEELSQQKRTVIDNGYSVFDDDIQAIQRNILKEVLRLMNRFAQKSGKIVAKDLSNKKTALLLKKLLSKFLNKETLKSQTSKFLKNFDDVEMITKKMLEKENKLDLSDFDLSTEKKMAIEKIAKSLLNDDMIEVNLLDPLQEIMYRQVTIGIGVKEAEAEFRNFIIGDEKNRGFASRYVKTIVRESLFRYDGMINQKAAIEFDLDSFRIVGPLRANSHISCIEMVRETGVLGAFAKDGKYKREDVPKMLKVMEKRPGFVKGTNASNYYMNRNHWGCYHEMIPTRSIPN